MEKLTTPAVLCQHINMFWKACSSNKPIKPSISLKTSTNPFHNTERHYYGERKRGKGAASFIYKN